MVPEHSSSIRAAGRADRDALVALLGRAFDEDPVMNWLLRQDSGRPLAFRRFFALSVAMTMPHGHVYMTGDATGAALWAPPGTWGRDRLRQLWHGPGLARAIGVGRLPSVLPAVMSVESRHPKTPHFYLYELGVVPESRGRGTGSRLLAHGLERCDAAAAPAYLESSNPRNVPLYERFGFVVTDAVTLGTSGPPVFLMWRDMG